jgi:hypothetical protein
MLHSCSFKQRTHNSLHETRVHSSNGHWVPLIQPFWNKGSLTNLSATNVHSSKGHRIHLTQPSWNIGRGVRLRASSHDSTIIIYRRCLKQVPMQSLFFRPFKYRGRARFHPFGSLFNNVVAATESARSPKMQCSWFRLMQPNTSKWPEHPGPASHSDIAH